MILENIRQLYPMLTKSQRKLADYIATSYQEVAFMTASRLAHLLGVNEATVIRFSQRLGYPGYPDLIRDIQAVVRMELKAGDEAAQTAAQENPFLLNMAGEIESLQRAVSHISPEVVAEALACLRSARRIIVIGQGVSACLAQLLAQSLRELGLPAEAPLSDALSLASALDSLDDRCVLVGIAAVAESIEVASALRLAGEQGAHTLALAWSPISPTAQAAELAVSATSSSHPAGDSFSFPSITLVATVIDALLQTLAAERRDELRQRAERHSEARDYILSRRRRS